MILSKVESGPSGFDRRTFECQRCGRIHTSIVQSAAVESDIPDLPDREFVPPTEGPAS